MHQAIQEIQEAFDQKGLKYRVEKAGDNDVLRLTMRGKNSNFELFFFKNQDNGNDVAVRVVNLVKFPEDRKEAGYEELNKLQVQYRFAQFTMREDGSVVVGYDFPTSYAPLGKGAVEILEALTQILELSYPRLMKVIWG